MNIAICLVGFAVSFGLLVATMPVFIKALKRHNISQTVSEYAIEEYKQKEKTPIMGGLLFVVIPVLVALVLNINNLGDKKMLFAVLSYVLYCSVGFIDDYIVIIKHDNEGLSPRIRLIMEFVYTVILYLLFNDVIETKITIPFANICIQIMPIIFVGFMALLYMAEANAVNFTDGMDGLCAGVSFISLLPFVAYCLIYKEKGLAIFLFAILGGLLGYLKFNYHPAKIFMGDSGSLALGALFAALGIVLDKTIALFVIGGVFVIEMFCVCLQLSSVKLFHKRVFSYTPIHYAFSLKGYKETRIVPSFYLVALVLAILGYLIGINTL